MSRLNPRILLAPALALLFLILFGAASYRGAAIDQVAMREIFAARFGFFQKLDRASGDIDAAQASVYRLMTWTGEYDARTIKSTSAEAMAGVDDAAALVKDLASQAQLDEEKRHLGAIARELAAYRKFLALAIDLAPDDVNLGVAALKTADTSYKALRHSFDALTELERSLAQQGYDQASATYRKSFLFAGIVFFVVLGAGLTGALVARTEHARLAESLAAQAALLESEGRHRGLFESMREGVACCQMLFENGRAMDFIYLEVNPAFEAQTGLKDVVGKKATEVFPSLRLTNPEILQTCGRVAETGQPERFQPFLEPLKMWFDVSVYSPKKDHFVAVFVNITDSRILEDQVRQAQKMEAVGRLAGGVAHDFNNILGVIMGYSELLEKQVDPGSKQARGVGQILRATERAASLTRQLLAFSRRQVLQAKILDLNAVVSDTDKMLRRVIGEDIELDVVLDPDLEPVKVDAGQMEQVLLNLAVNARDAMPKGGRLTIETGNLELDEALAHLHALTPGTYVRLSVRDTGCGMDSEVEKHIFEPFFTTKEKGTGTGLGLAMVYGIVKQSGGSISVESEPGQGTTFEIYLPRENKPLATRSSALSSPAPKGGTILLVEDETGLRESTCELLRASGYAVFPAAGGAEAIALAEGKAGTLDLLLTDVVMPGMDGRELAAKIIAQRPGIKVVYMSGYSGETIAQHGVLDPGTFFLRKPFRVEDLTRTVREALADFPPGSALALSPTVPEGLISS